MKISNRIIAVTLNSFEDAMEDNNIDLNFDKGSVYPTDDDREDDFLEIIAEELDIKVNQIEEVLCSDGDQSFSEILIVLKK